MSDTATLPLWTPIRRFFMSTPRRTFILYPLLVILFEFTVYRQLTVAWWGLPFLVWGYLQYKLTGAFRHGIAKGSSGMTTMPEQLVEDGLYSYIRNPMYLGHLIFLFGLTLTTQSWLALVILIGNIVWFHRRVLRDEARLLEAFGEPYEEYMSRVKRWIPGIY